MKRIHPATALAVAASTLVAAPAQAATSTSAFNCDGVTGGVTVTEYVGLVSSRNCVLVSYDGDKEAAQAITLARPTSGKASTSNLTMYHRPCSGPWQKVARNPDNDGWWADDPRDSAKTKLREGVNRSQWYATATYSSKSGSRVTSHTLRTPVAGRC